MSVTDDLLAHNEQYAAEFAGPLPLPPARGLAVVACMDARLDVYRILGLREGEAHVIRNAGGVVTDDEIRSLAISQRLLGTREVVLIHHTDCGLAALADGDVRDATEADGGERHLDDDVRDGVARITSSPYVPHTDQVRGFVFDVATGRLREVA